ncbi:MAG: 50S ribosome-binding GTPase [Desulfobacterales bacterium]|nr:50S ribosome-binding GTPase [Desulfobacterales bacterium]
MDAAQHPDPEPRCFAEDLLFATLDPSSRRLRFPRDREVIITDTVGFIRDLPRDLMVAFRATLEELESADLLLHVIDMSHPRFEDQIRAGRNHHRRPAPRAQEPASRCSTSATWSHPRSLENLRPAARWRRRLGRGCAHPCPAHRAHAVHDHRRRSRHSDSTDDRTATAGAPDDADADRRCTT